MGAAIRQRACQGLARARTAPRTSSRYGYFTKATEVQPENADAWYQLGFFQLADARLPARGAAGLQPRDGARRPKNPRYNAAATRQTLAQVNSGKPKC